MGWATSYIECLQKGETIEFRPSGNSMTPRISSGDLCRVKPLGQHQLVKNDIVLCKVNGREFLHLVSAVKSGKAGVFSVQISNNKNKVNGWCSVKSVYGLLISATK